MYAYKTIYPLNKLNNTGTLNFFYPDAHPGIQSRQESETECNTEQHNCSKHYTTFDNTVVQTSRVKHGKSSTKPI